MKIAYISATDIKGGAARGAYRLHSELIRQGVDSTLIVSRKYSDDPSVKTLNTPAKLGITFLKIAISRLILKLQKPAYWSTRSLNLFRGGIAKHLNNSNYDAVILHWIGGESLSIKEIKKINKPIIWRLADQWAFCGTEHYVPTEYSERFINGYRRSNKPKGNRGIDIDRWIWKKKDKALRHKDITIICSSQWLYDCAQKSHILRNKNIKKIPTGLNINTYKPLNKSFARDALNLPKDKNIILFGSIAPNSDERKGYNLLKRSFQLLGTKTKNASVSAIFGVSEDQASYFQEIKVYTFPHLSDDYSLALLYSSADVMVVPSKQEAFGQTASEAIACGTPVVAFEGTGMADFIEHKRTGYLAKPYCAQDLAQGIEFLLNANVHDSKISKRCREIATSYLDVHLQAYEYIKTIKKII